MLSGWKTNIVAIAAVVLAILEAVVDGGVIPLDGQTLFVMGIIMGLLRQISKGESGLSKTLKNPINSVLGLSVALAMFSGIVGGVGSARADGPNIALEDQLVPCFDGATASGGVCGVLPAPKPLYSVFLCDYSLPNAISTLPPVCAYVLKGPQPGITVANPKDPGTAVVVGTWYHIPILEYVRNSDPPETIQIDEVIVPPLPPLPVSPR